MSSLNADDLSVHERQNIAILLLSQLTCTEGVRFYPVETVDTECNLSPLGSVPRPASGSD